MMHPSSSTGSAVDPTTACAAVVDQLRKLPAFGSPKEATAALHFSDGLYFFFEAGEVSTHASDGRVVRVGNHPRAAGGLVRRLRNHYRGGRGAKNGSVFRKYLGGSLMRRDDPSFACLGSQPGQGHWEHQNEPACELCAPFEARVNALLGDTFRFKCVWIPDRDQRNRLEHAIVATLALCRVCRPSENWLGAHSYSSVVKETGLWNSQGVTAPPLTAQELDAFAAMIERTASA